MEVDEEARAGDVVFVGEEGGVPQIPTNHAHFIPINLNHLRHANLLLLIPI